MIKESRGQVSLEYLLVFTVSLILIIAFTLPLCEEAIKDTMDVSDVLSAKSELSKLAHAVKIVYGQGQGSRQAVNLHITRNTQINIVDDCIYLNMKLSDNTNKQIREYADSNIGQTSFSLNKGDNTIIVEWPESSQNMIIHR